MTDLSWVTGARRLVFLRDDGAPDVRESFENLPPGTLKNLRVFPSIQEAMRFAARAAGWKEAHCASPSTTT